jgi:hypothetical protein
MKLMQEQKKNFKIDYDVIKRHEKRVRDLSEKRRQEEEMKLRAESKINQKVTVILDSFKKKFVYQDEDYLRKLSRFEMIKRQRTFASQVD